MLGIAHIDDQHREIFRRGNLLVEGCCCGRGQGEVAAVINFLGDYVRRHFIAEEQFHERSDWPKRIEHREQHAAFLQRYRTLSEHLAEQGAGHELAILAHEIVFGWWVPHISRADREFAEFLRSR